MSDIPEPDHELSADAASAALSQWVAWRRLRQRAHARLVVCRELTDDAQADCEVIRDLLATLAPAAATSADLDWLARYCDQVVADGILPSIEWFRETAVKLRQSRTPTARYGCKQCQRDFDHEPRIVNMPGSPARTFFFCSDTCRTKWLNVE